MTRSIVSNNRDIKTTNSDGNGAFRVIITEPNPADAPPPNNIQLSNTSVIEGSSIGTFIANITVDGGVAPITYTIADDPDGVFQIDGNDLEVGNTIDFDTADQHNVSIRATDINGKFTEQTFLITVVESQAAINRQVSFNGIDEIMNCGNVPEINAGNTAFTLIFTAQRFRENKEETLFSMNLNSTNQRGFRVWFDVNNRLNAGFFEDITSNLSIIRRSNVNHTVNTRLFYKISYDGTKTAGGFNVRRDDSITGNTVVNDTLSTGNISAQTFNNFTVADLRTGGNKYQGLIDNIFLFNRIITASEETTIYNGGAPLENISSNPSLLIGNVIHAPINNLDVYPTITDLRGNYNFTMNANMNQSNIVVVP